MNIFVPCCAPIKYFDTLKRGGLWHFIQLKRSLLAVQAPEVRMDQEGAAEPEDCTTKDLPPHLLESERAEATRGW